jgi:hypothetical protein
MNDAIHKDLAQGRWFTFAIEEQLANVGSEFGRAAAAHQSGNLGRFEGAFDRMLDLLDLTISDQRWRETGSLKELVRLREEVCDVFYGNDTYGTSIETLNKYFLYFGIAARVGR